ncbi:MAG: SHOCT domain-containing protein, partial [Nitrospirales bacterium]
LITGCTSPSMMSRMIIDEPSRMVRLEVMYREGSQEHNHPEAMTPDKIEKILRTITAPPNPLPSWQSREIPQDNHPAFHDEQIQFFAQAFATAFTKASPLEEVMFYWNEAQDSGLQEVTSGRSYIHGQQFHLLISNYRHAISGQQQADQAKKQPQRMLGAHISRLQPDQNGQIQSDDPWSRFTESSPQHLVFALHELSFNSLDRTSPDSPIMEKFETLKALREKQFISEEEYQKKRRELLAVF